MKYLPILLSLISAISFGLAIYFIFMNTNEFSNKIKHNKTIIVSLILLAISLVIIGFTIDYIVDIYKEPQDFKKDFSKIGTYGDFFGGILNPILAFIGIIAASLAFYAQYEANKQVQVQFEEQKKNDYVQKFESNFYNLLSIHHQIVSDIDLKTKKIFHFNKELESFIKENKFVDESFAENIIIESESSSRDAFVYIFDLLDYFLWIDMEIYYGNDIEYIKDNIKDVNKFHNIFKNKYEIKCNGHILVSKFPDIYNTIYSAVSSDLGHYFRNLYRIVKYIDNANFSSNLIQDYKIKYDYTSILRAQISDAELKILFLNCIYYHGNEKFKPLLEKYTFFKIINRANEENNFFKNYSPLYKEEAFINSKKDSIIKEILDQKNFEKVIIKRIVETSGEVEQA
ncbi:putative phage abortive infection protein [Flavobacterium sp.]|uniref:putative phage abortive infection protein n=1 Tax=Flavobacterium sp. TaxID=239 RepID=UPI0040481F0C